MASLSNINGLFDVHSTGAILFSTSHGTSGQILRSNGNAAPTWVAASTVIGGPYLPLTGGTLSGPLSGTSATFSGVVNTTSGYEKNGYDVIGQNGTTLRINNAAYWQQLELFTNGTPRLTILANGNTGIGTSTPTNGKLVIASTQNNSNDYTWLLFDNKASGYGDWSVYKSGNNDLSFGYGTDNGASYTNALTLEYGGNVGIGTDSPAYKLVVEDSASDIFYGATDATSGSMFRLRSNNKAVTIFNTNADGDTGIGINGYTNAKLGVYGNLALLNGSQINLTGTLDSDKLWYGMRFDNNEVQIYTYNASNRSITFNTVFGGTGIVDQLMKIEAGGNVGIGTTGPVTKLHVSNTALINDAYGLALVENTSTGTGSAANSALNIKSKYGTSQFMQWENQGLRIGSRILNNGGVGNVYFTAGADSVKMVIQAGGQVRIGTTNTAALLNVGGPILASDNNQSAGMYVRRALTIGHPGNTGTFTRTFNPVTQFGISRLGGNVLLEVSGWSQKVNCGYIQFQNAGGGGNLTTVSYTQTAVSGTGSISVSINSANDNSIDINFSGWHTNGHAWQAKIITQ